MTSLDLTQFPVMVSEFLAAFEAVNGRLPFYRRDDDNPDLLLIEAGQAEVDAALAAYDHPAVIAARAAAEGMAAAEKVMNPNMAALAALLRVVTAQLNGETPDPVDVAFLGGAITEINGLETIFANPATASMPEAERRPYITQLKAGAAQARGAYAAKIGGAG